MSIILILSVFVLTILLIIVLHPIAMKIGFTDRPCHRKQHKTPTPLIGGLAAYLAILAACLVNEEMFSHQFAYLTAITILVSVGLVDDYRGLGVRIRLIAQIIAVLIMTEYADLKVTNLGDLVALGDIDVQGMARLFTIFAVVGGINAFNMIDGIDGLAGGLTLIAIGSIALVAGLYNDLILLNFCCVFIAILVGFLLFNLRIFGRKSAKIFLGDTGSTLFGFTVSWLTIYASQGEQAIMSPSLVLWLIAIPVVDSVCIMFRRMSKGRSPFSADREHLHHILSLAGYSINQVLIRLLVAAALFSLIAITVELRLQKADSILFACFLLFFGAYYWCMSYAWTMMKIARYIRNKLEGNNDRGSDRRKSDRRINQEPVSVERRALACRRSGQDRRFVPSQTQLKLAFDRKTRLATIAQKINGESVTTVTRIIK